MLDAAAIDGMLAEVLPKNVWEMYSDRVVGDDLARFVELLVRWNRVVSLTSSRSPEEIVRRHIAGSLCCAAALPECDSLLDVGSGAGFPGIPVQLMWPELHVTLAESHRRKAAFLREAIRELQLGTEVFAGRAQDLAKRSFMCVCLRAVDPMKQALEAASTLASEWVCVVGSPGMRRKYEAGLIGWDFCGIESCDYRRDESVVYRYSRRD